ncbi:MAG: hypothetical protein ACT4PO_10085 [Actinomycetota bacterium]
MFIRYFLQLQLPFEDVGRALLSSPEEWLPGLLREAEDRGDRLLAEVGFGTDGRRIKKRVEITMETPIRITSKTILPITWRATGASRLFPSLDADIEVAVLGPSQTQLSISARYRPPLGALGKAIDRALLHRVAEATVKDFLDRVGEALQDRVDERGRSVEADA